MTPEHFQRLEVLFHEAIELDPILQQGWIDAHCEDAELRDALTSLIAHHNQEAIIDTPVELTAATVPNPVGFVLDRKYRIERELGHGGMGNVFLATHLGTERPVALKIIRPEFSANPEYLSRFKREAIAAGKLRHPNIVNVTDFGVAPFGKRSAAYLVMEYLTGESLADRLAATPKLSLAETLDILEQTCAAVGAAHETGIIHRDLKPENIWRQPDGRGGALVKVLDFGLAKLTDQLDSPALPLLPRSASENETLPGNQPTTLQVSEHSTFQALTFYERDTRPASDYPKADFESTLAGAVMGTPLYMSPEQCAGKKVDRASDIYSLGVIAYRMLAGTTPFTGDLFQLMLKHREEIPEPLARKQRDIPAGVAGTITRALAKTPAERPLSAAAFAAALRVHADGDAAITLEADRLWRAHRATLMKLTARVAFPGILVTAFLISMFVQHWSIEFRFIWIVQAALWLIPLVILRTTADFTTASLAYAIPNLRQNHSVDPAAITAEIRRERYAFFRLGLKTMFRPQRRLAIPSAVTDGFPRAIDRSEKHLAGLTRFAQTVVAKRRAQYTGMLLFGTFACIPFLAPEPNLFWENFLNSVTPAFGHIRPDVWGWQFITCLAVLSCYTVLRLPKSALETVVLHETARILAGETLPTAAPRFSEDLKPRLALPGWLQLPVTRTWVRMLVVAWCATYLLFVPPMSLIPKVERRHYERIPYPENAWDEYRIAIRKLGGEESAGQTGQQHALLRTYAFQKSPLTEEIRTILNNNQEALRHLVAGTKRRRFQFTTEDNGTQTQAPNGLAVRRLVTLVAAEVRRLQETGRDDETIELMASAFRMCNDFAEKEAPLVSLIIALEARRDCCRMVQDWITRGGCDAARQEKLLRRLAELERGVNLNFRPYFDNEIRFLRQTLEDTTIARATARFSPSQPVWLFQEAILFAPGMRLSTSNGFRRYWEREQPFFERAARNWEFAEVRQRQRHENSPLIDPGVAPEELIGTYCARILSPNWFAVMRNLYRNQAFFGGMLALLACDTYKKRHGAFPTNLETAIEECGIAMPVDPVTGRAPGYRLADGVPELWFVGYDRQDDGGKTPYNLEKNHNQIIPGTDFMMRYGQPVAW